MRSLSHTHHYLECDYEGCRVLIPMAVQIKGLGHLEGLMGVVV
jgi:hypothetical protein